MWTPSSSITSLESSRDLRQLRYSSSVVFAPEPVAELELDLLKYRVGLSPPEVLEGTRRAAT